jgi:23S rRNA (cytosine1962-C5)-methyltransferase
LARLDANIALNQQPPEQHRLLKADARKWLGRAVRRAEQLGSQAKFDRIVLDPPSFASSGAETFSVASDYFELAAQCLTLLKDDGSLLAVTNHRKTTRAEFETGLFEAARRAGREVKLEWINPPLDCPHGAHADAATKSVFVSSV